MQHLCTECNKVYSNNSNLRKHIRIVHNKKSEFIEEDENTKFRCVECKINFRFNYVLRNHLGQLHGLQNIVEDLHFESFDDFWEWKSEVEGHNNVLYVLNSSKMTSKSKHTYYQCQHSNAKKTFACVSQIIAQTDIDSGECHIKYYKLHYHNDSETQELKISKKAKPMRLNKNPNDEALLSNNDKSVADPLSLGLDNSANQHFFMSQEDNKLDAVSVATDFNRKIKDKKNVCCISNCALKGPNLKLFKFPNSLLVINLWKEALNIHRNKTVTNFYVCDQHFDERDFISGTRKLKKLALPSVQRNDEKEKTLSKNTSVTHCSVCRCTCGQRQSSNVINMFHNYSKSHEDLSRSVESLSDENKKSTMVICDEKAKIIIQSEDVTLKLKIADQVKKILEENISEEHEEMKTKEKSVEEINSADVLPHFDEQEFPLSYLDTFFKIFCQYCDEFFPNVKDLIRHVKEIHDFVSDAEILTEKQLQSGMRNCKFCNQVTNNLQEHKIHVNQCPHNPDFKGPQKPIKAVNNPSAKRKFANNQYKQRFFFKRNHRHYEDTHYMHRIRCSHCQKSFKGTKSLKDHIKRAHPGTKGMTNMVTEEGGTASVIVKNGVKEKVTFTYPVKNKIKREAADVLGKRSETMWQKKVKKRKLSESNSEDERRNNKEEILSDKKDTDEEVENNYLSEEDNWYQEEEYEFLSSCISQG